MSLRPRVVPGCSLFGDRLQLLGVDRSHQRAHRRRLQSRSQYRSGKSVPVQRLSVRSVESLSAAEDGGSMTFLRDQTQVSECVIYRIIYHLTCGFRPLPPACAAPVRLVSRVGRL